MPTNVRVNGNEPFASTQSEISFASAGPRMVAAWNDGDAPGGTQQGIGFAYSSDGGRSWIDGGALPRTGGVAVWISDPVVAADPARGHFYVAGLVIAVGPTSGLAVIRGGFHGSAFQWETPRLVRGVRDTFPDKPWLAADSVSGNLYLSYTTFFRKQGKPSDQIEMQRSTDQNQSWSIAAKISLG